MNTPRINSEQSAPLSSPQALFHLKPLEQLLPASAPTSVVNAPKDHSDTQALPKGSSAQTLSLMHPPSGQQIAPGVWYDTSRKTPEGGKVRLLTLDPAQAELVPIVKSKPGPINASSLAQDKKLIAAINASFFGTMLIGDLQSGSQIVTDDTNSALDKITDQRYFIAVGPDGKIHTGKGGLKEQTQAFKHFIGGFPALYTREQFKHLDQDIQNGNFDKRASYGGDVKKDSISRSFMGITADGKVILVAAGIGNQRALGVTMAQGARLMRELGAVEAYILDGGGSSTVYVKDKEHARTDGRQVWSYLGIKSP